jgi:hypothetical protein
MRDERWYIDYPMQTYLECNTLGYRFGLRNLEIEGIREHVREGIHTFTFF